MTIHVEMTHNRIALLVFITLLAGSPLYAQTLWGRYQGGANVDETLAVTGDASGATYSAGYFSSSAQVNGVTLAVNGLTDIFVTKSNPAGATVWSISAGGSQSDRGLGIAVDGGGNILVCGFITGTVNFGGGVSLSANAGSQDAFIAKFNAAGQAIWARSGGSSGSSDRANAVAIDGSGNVFITGQFTGEATFGPFTLSGSGATNDIFIVKYDPNGNELWAKKGSGTGLNRGLGITTDSQGAAYVTGQFSGDITFDNFYPNTILNALFLVKYAGDGSEAWFRWAGGSNQSIGYGIASNGTNVYLTGDCGQSITFLGGTGTNVITTGYQNAVFIAGFGSNGNYLWGTSEGSSSNVSVRGISHLNGQLGIAGWFECTFESLSQEYGTGTFNNVGFKDVFISRYNTSGQFLWARQFASRTDEVANGIHILPDNFEVVCGNFESNIYIPVRQSLNVSGLTAVTPTHNPNLNYCGDAHYGEFSQLAGSAGLDGFLLKTVDLERLPYDFYKRYAGACNADVPDACIANAGTLTGMPCNDDFLGCPPYSVQATPYTNFQNSLLGYGFSVQWNTGSFGNPLPVTGPASLIATITSTDGCYTTIATADVDVLPIPAKPTMSDNYVVNTEDISPEPVFLCPGETVDLWFQTDPGNTFVWAGSNVTPEMSTQPVITVSQSGAYQVIVTNADGCTASNFILVVVYPDPPPPLDPYLFFPQGDTLVQCLGFPSVVEVWDFFTDAIAEPQGYTWTWSVTPQGQAGGTSSGGVAVGISGWYVISVEIEYTDNPCSLLEDPYLVTDSIYIVVNSPPQVDLTLEAPEASCGGPVVIVIETNADMISFPAYSPLQVWGMDSILVSGPGQYSVMATSTSELGCSATSIQTVLIDNVLTPVIATDPGTAVICPGEEVEIYTNSIGTITWQGPNGFAGTGLSITVNEPGLYFAEVFFYPGCALVSNTVQVAEYATPFLASSNALLCQGDSVIISVISTDINSIEWLAPLSGNDTLQVIYEPGSYTAVVSSCGISTEVTIVVELSDFPLDITQPDQTPVCDGDSILIVASPGLSGYIWNNSNFGDSIYVYAPGTLQATATDPNGCTLVSNVLPVDFEPIPPVPAFTFVPPCFGETLTISVQPGYTASWYSTVGDFLFEGQSTSIDSFVADTAFVVVLSSEWCTGDPAEESISPKPLPDDPLPATDAPVCIGTQLLLDVLNPQGGVQYTWITADGSSLQGAPVSFSVNNEEDEGQYSVFALLDGCRSDTTLVDVALFTPRQVDLPPDTTLCLQAEYLLFTDTIYLAYIWQDGSTGDTLMPTMSGEYFVQTTDFNGCKTADVVNIGLVDCDVDIPNVFTPNGDGLNDAWVVAYEQARFFKITIYNRWGRMVFESTAGQPFWDGNNFRNGEPCSEGVYFYIAEIISFDGIDYGKTGNITLLRQ